MISNPKPCHPPSVSSDEDRLANLEKMKLSCDEDCVLLAALNERCSNCIRGIICKYKHKFKLINSIVDAKVSLARSHIQSAMAFRQAQKCSSSKESARAARVGLTEDITSVASVPPPSENRSSLTSKAGNEFSFDAFNELSESNCFASICSAAVNVSGFCAELMKEKRVALAGHTAPGFLNSESNTNLMFASSEHRMKDDASWLSSNEDPCWNMK